MAEVAQAARAAPALTGPARPQDLLLDGLAINATDGPTAAAPILRKVLSSFSTVQLAPEEAWWFGYAQVAANLLWDYGAFHSLAARFLQAARDLGALRMLPWALDGVAAAHVWGGDLVTAASLAGEQQSVIEATGSSTTPFAVIALAVWRGHEAEGKSAIAGAIEHACDRGQGATIKVLQSAAATLCNSLGQYEEALTAAQRAASPPLHYASYRALRELVEAAARSGRPAVAAEAVERLSRSTQASGTDWGLGVEAQSRALVSTGDTSEALFHDAIERLDHSPVRPEAARAHLLFGEWLRREKRRVDVRQQLRVAYDMFLSIGADGFAERARHELLATGETVRKRSQPTRYELTPQEEHIARLASDGRTNPEIGSELFISSRTVEWHLRNVFTKLEISSRRELRRAFPNIQKSAAVAVATNSE